MPTITGEYRIYHKSGKLKDIELYTIDLVIGQRVQFKDNSVLQLCHLNSKDIKPAGIYGDIGKEGTVISYTSSQIAEGNFGWESDHIREIEMPIVIRCDDGQIIYCNPLNIDSLPLHHD